MPVCSRMRPETKTSIDKNHLTSGLGFLSVHTRIKVLERPRKPILGIVQTEQIKKEYLIKSKSEYIYNIYIYIYIYIYIHRILRHSASYLLENLLYNLEILI